MEEVSILTCVCIHMCVCVHMCVCLYVPGVCMNPAIRTVGVRQLQQLLTVLQLISIRQVFPRLWLLIRKCMCCPQRGRPAVAICSCLTSVSYNILYMASLSECTGFLVGATNDSEIAGTPSHSSSSKPQDLLV